MTAPLIGAMLLVAGGTGLRGADEEVAGHMAEQPAAARAIGAGIDWRLFALLTAAGAIGAVAVIPLVFTLQAEAIASAGLPLPLLAAVQVVQTTLLVVLAVLVGLGLGPKVGLGAPLLASRARGTTQRGALRAVAGVALAVGAIGALAVVALDVVVFRPAIAGLEGAYAPLWQRLLASLYGGVTEEILLRLGLFTLLAFVLTRVLGGYGTVPGSAVLWSVNVVVAALFGLAHLPATASLVAITPLVITRAVVLNGLLGIGFGYLYWTRGLTAAIIAHLTADVVLQLATGLV